MSDKPKIPDLLSEAEAARDYPRLRLAAGKALNPGPWQHKHQVAGWCEKCGRLYQKTPDCPAPDPATGSLPEIAEELLRRCEEGELFCAIDSFWSPGLYWALHWKRFAFATPAERIACCLAVLGEVEV